MIIGFNLKRNGKLRFWFTFATSKRVWKYGKDGATLILTKSSKGLRWLNADTFKGVMIDKSIWIGA